MILGWGLAGGSAYSAWNSISPCLLAEVSSLSKGPLLSGARHLHPPGLGLNLTLC